MRKEQLVLVHGVDSFGEWYPTVQKVMNVHFDCVPHEYTDYRFGVNHLGKISVAIGPRWVIASMLILLAGIGILYHFLVEGNADFWHIRLCLAIAAASSLTLPSVPT